MRAKIVENFLDKLRPKIPIILPRNRNRMYSKIFLKVDTKVGLNLPKGGGKLNNNN